MLIFVANIFKYTYTDYGREMMLDRKEKALDKSKHNQVITSLIF